MNNKIDALLDKHIERLEEDVAAAQKRIHENGFSDRGMESIGMKDDLKKIALLREGVIPKYSDLPAGQVTGLNGLPEIEMFEFADLMDETTAAMHDLDLIDYGKELGKNINKGE